MSPVDKGDEAVEYDWICKNEYARYEGAESFGFVELGDHVEVRGDVRVEHESVSEAREYV